MPASLNEPCFFNSPDATPITASTAPLTSLGFKPTVSATDLYTLEAVKIVAFIAFAGAMA
eukprot:CAMPEP_0194476278 /NCGR_PEP_ID=MMETSP0253-20130528/175_1 /TAXON_ID=2966 /ORGANISM="Noctiluca scintillans" /LENGTH=59 /DNA_ID=CAMNT_0039315125 /DNA_START=75 /DNA_END=251 /DNA_ORIENTATION=+